MATNNSVNTNLSGQTGTGSFVGSISSILTTPTIGNATATSLAFNPTADGVIGTILVNDASSGFVGEFISSTILFASATAVTSTVNKNVTSINVPAGDWNIEGNIYSQATTNFILNFGYLSLISATRPDTSFVTGINTSAATTICAYPVTAIRLSVTGNTTVFLVAEFTFTGTCLASGGIYARRIR